MCWRGDTDSGIGRLATLRKEISEHLAPVCRPDTRPNAELVVGELLANVYRHAPGPFCVEVHCDDQNARLSVHDSGDCFDCRFDAAPPPNQLVESGRGMAIIAAAGVQVDVLRGASGGCCVTVAFPGNRKAVARHTPTACPRAHPGRRGEHCRRVIEEHHQPHDEALRPSNER